MTPTLPLWRRPGGWPVRTGLWVAAWLCALVLAGCAQPPPQRDSATDHWRGRMALAVQGESARSFSAAFELAGDSTRGSLVLTSPLGTTLARIRWRPGQAEFWSPEQASSAHSLDTLVQDALGSTLPLQALFGWLHGNAVAATGWDADLSALPQGRLVAVRHTPAPRATLRLVLDRAAP